MTHVDHSDDQVPTPEENLHEAFVGKLERHLAVIRANPPGGKLPQLRVFQARLKATTTLLTVAGERLGHLHELAYDRTKAAERVPVRGGSRDYALDTNGDPKARELYRQVMLELLTVMEFCTLASHDMVKFIQGGEVTHRRLQGSATNREVLDALAYGQRRAERGERDTPVEDQPTVSGPLSVGDAVERMKRLQDVVAKIQPSLSLQEREALVPLEVTAHQRAVDAHELRERVKAMEADVDAARAPLQEQRKRPLGDLLSEIENLEELIGKSMRRLKSADRSRLSAQELSAHRSAIDEYHRRHPTAMVSNRAC